MFLVVVGALLVVGLGVGGYFVLRNQKKNAQAQSVVGSVNSVASVVAKDAASVVSDVKSKL